MTAVLPNGFLTILQATDALLPAMYAGVPDLPVVSRLRDEGLDVRDGRQRTEPLQKSGRQSMHTGCESWQSVDDLVG